MTLYDVDDDHDGLAWLSRMACVDCTPGDFFVEPGHVISPAKLQMCRSCPVRAECVTHCYNREHTAGYFGGLSPSFRKKHTLEEALVFIANDPPR